MGGIHEGHSMIPDNSKKKLEQLRQEMAFRAQLQKQYDKEMSKVPMAQMIPFSQWMDQRPKPMKKGGKVDALMEELRKSVGNEPFDPIGTAKRNIQGAVDIAKQVPSNLKRLAADPVAYAKSLPEPSGEQIMNMLQPSTVGAMAGVIKPVGGNWLNRTVENELLPLRQKVGYSLDPEAQLKKLSAKYTPEVIASLDPNSRVDVQRMLKETAESAAVNKWIDSNLTNYVKKQMATPEDPVRKLAEEGVTAFPIAEDPRFWNRMGESARGQYEGTPMAKSDLAKQWENRSDTMIGSDTAQQHQDMMHLAPGMYEKADEFIKKLPPETPLYKTSGAGTRFNPSDLGFDHIIDVLKQDVAAGRIRPEQLNKVSMEQAVRRTHELDQEMARRMREAAIKQTEGFPVHKDYADKGYKWIELAKPAPATALPEGWSAPVEKGNALQTRSPNGDIVLGFDMPDLINNIYKRHPDTPGNPYTALEQALKYEGDTMGHCVGGYCPDVAAGRSRIFSLRDAKGEPHVTIETMPYRATGKEVPPEIMHKWNHKASFPELQQYKTLNEYLQAEHPEIHAKINEPRPDEIIQIKGKQNAKPKEDYLPYVQDFVKSGDWTKVGDLQNTGLRSIESVPERARFESAGMKLPKYVTDADHEALINEYLKLTSHPPDLDFMHKAYGFPKPDVPPAEGMKRGGKVRIASGITSQDEMRLALTRRRGTTKS